MSVEVNVASVFAKKIDQLVRFFASESWTDQLTQVDARVASATDLGHIPSRSVDYVFTDPPFGANIFYADCALITESWLGTLTDTRAEAVVNRSLSPTCGGKTVEDYGALMTSALGEVARVLKPRGAATLIFPNTDAAVWAALERAVGAAGLECRHATTLDKTQNSHKGYRGRDGTEDVAGFDIVLTLRHQRSTHRSSPRPLPRTQADATSALRDHLAALPPIGRSPVADRRRTLPYLYSFLLQADFNGEIGLHERGYSCVRELCEASFRVDRDGRWFVSGRSHAVAVDTAATHPRRRHTVGKELTR